MINKGLSKLPGCPVRRLTACGSAASASASASAAGSATAYLTPAATRGAGAPRSRPSVLRSSSTSGQWIPYPAPMICQFWRCSGVASRSLGYQTRGTVIVRPSARSTLSVSSEKWTSRTASPGLGSEIVIPCLQQPSPILENQSLDCAQLARAEAEIPRQGHRLEPEFGRRLIPIDVNVSRFTKIMTHEVYSVGPAEKNRRHLNSLTEGRRTLSISGCAKRRPLHAIVMPPWGDGLTPVWLRRRHSVTPCFESTEHATARDRRLRPAART
jgi:hypothetical protein